jgi:hypothetical protein
MGPLGVRVILDRVWRVLAATLTIGAGLLAVWLVAEGSWVAVPALVVVGFAGAAWHDLDEHLRHRPPRPNRGDPSPDSSVGSDP